MVGPQGSLDEDVWELYDTNTDWSQAHDLAAAQPGKLAELKRLFELEAGTYNVFPLDETLEVGCDLGEPVSEDYGARGNEFTGTVRWVQIDIDAAAKDVDHTIGAEERFRFAMTRQ